jgi:uncharacterized protein YukE
MSNPDPYHDPVPAPTPEQARKAYAEIIANARKVDEFTTKHHLTAPLLVPLLTQFELIDIAGLKDVAAAWGTGGTATGYPPDLANHLKTEITSAVTSVASTWQGPGHDAFVTTMGKVTTLVDEIVAPSQEIGKALDGMAEAWKLTAIEIVGWGATLAGLVLVLAALPTSETPPGAVVEGVLFVTTAFVALLAAAVSVVGSLGRVFTSVSTKMTIEDEINSLMPNLTDTERKNADPAGWKPR